MSTDCKKKSRGMLIAVDGLAASGKGTIGKRLADHFGLAYLDTGKLYRATARDALAAGWTDGADDIASQAARQLDADTLDDPSLMSSEIGRAASKIASISTVRQALMAYQRAFCLRPEGALLDGRDIASVIAPEADVKLFVTASLEARAERRAAQLRARGESVDLCELTRDLAERDERDLTRADAPLVKTPDAHLLDTTDLSIDAAFAAALALVEAACRSTSSPMI